MEQVKIETILQPYAKDFYLSLDKNAKEIISKLINEICENYNETITVNESDDRDADVIFTEIAVNKFKQLNENLNSAFNEIKNKI